MNSLSTDPPDSQRFELDAQLAQLAERAAGPNARVLSALKQQIAEENNPRRSWSRLTRVLFSGLALGGGLVLSSLAKLADDPRTLVLSAAALCLSLGALLFAGAIPGEGRLGRGPRGALVTGLGAALFLWLALQADHYLLASALWGEQSAGTFRCAGHALISGVFSSTALMLAWRRTDPFSPRLSGALLGLMGGLVGTASVELLCASHEGAHLLIGHGGTAALLALVGYAIGRSCLDPS